MLLDAIIPVRSGVRPPSPLHGDKIGANDMSSPKKDNSTIAMSPLNGISLTNQAKIGDSASLTPF